MKKGNKWLVVSLILMIFFFLASGFFFLKSGLVDFRYDDFNYEVLKELEIFNIKLSEYLHIPTNEKIDMLENMSKEEYRIHIKSSS